MAILMVTGVLDREPRSFTHKTQNGTGIGMGMWLKEDDQNIRFPITWYDVPENSNIGEGSHVQVRAQVRRKENKKTSTWEWDFVAMEVTDIEETRETDEAPVPEQGWF
jgi:hypothetical protein